AAERRVEAVTRRVRELAERARLAVEEEELPVGARGALELAAARRGRGAARARLKHDEPTVVVHRRLDAIAEAGGQLDAAVRRPLVHEDLLKAVLEARDGRVRVEEEERRVVAAAGDDVAADAGAVRDPADVTAASE